MIKTGDFCAQRRFVAAEAFESPPEACSLRFNGQGQVVEYTAGVAGTHQFWVGLVVKRTCFVPWFKL